MTRLALCALLCGLTVLLALLTAVIQSQNRDHGIALDALKQECDVLEAVNGGRCERILARDWSPLPSTTPATPEAADKGGARTGRTATP